MNWKSSIFYIVMFAVSITFGNSSAEESVTLINNGTASSVVIVSDEAHPDEVLAVEELNEHLEKISGTRIPVVRVKSTEVNAEIRNTHRLKQIPLLIGEIALDDKLIKTIHLKSDDPASFLIKVDAGSVRIGGLSPEGTLYGTYELLEQFGCRWFMPTDFGTVVPRNKTVSVAVQQTIQVPSFEGRCIQTVEKQCRENNYKWYRRLRLNGGGVPGAHHIYIGDANLKDNPELYALVDGKRTDRQLCLSNPEVLSRAVEQSRQFFRQNPDADMMGMGPADDKGFCECENCRALDGGDWDPFVKMGSVTDRYVWFFNKVLEGISDEFPDKYLSFYAYHAYLRAPVKVKPDPRIIPAFAPLWHCSIHGMSNPVCPERYNYRQLIAEWSKLVPRFFERGYYLNAAGLPVSFVDKIRNDMPLLKKIGCPRIRRETSPHWGSMTPSIYIAAKLLWDADADVDTLEQDFYDKYFGPASIPMGRYFERIDKSVREVDRHPYYTSINIATYLSPDQMKVCKTDLDHAARLTEQTPYAERVAAIRLMFDILETYDSMIKRYAALDFVGAKNELDRFLGNQEKACRHQPALLFKPQVEHVAKTSVRTVNKAYENTTGGKLLVGLPIEWGFLIDPPNIGETLGFWRRELKGGNWQSIKSYRFAWQDRGLNYYSGDAWYRTTVVVPERVIDDRRVFIWFSGVHHGAKVWLNGVLLGECSGSSTRPSQLDATGAIELGQKNIIAVKTNGPIYGPVMFYVAKE